MKIYKNILICAVFLFIGNSVFSQYSAKVRNNNIYATFGTSYDFQESSLYYSITSLAYERNLFFSKNGVWNARAGLGRVSLFSDHLGYFYHADFVYVHGIYFHHLEFALGVSGLYNSQISKLEWWANDLERPLPLSIYLGYRYHIPNGRYIFRAGAGWPEQVSVSFGTSF